MIFGDPDNRSSQPLTPALCRATLRAWIRHLRRASTVQKRREAAWNLNEL